MTDEDQDHEQLQRLFDATADAPSGPTLTKLAARAVDVPERAAKRARFLPRWAWRPALAGTGVALGGVLALLCVLPRSRAVHGPVAELAAAAPSVSGSLALAAASAKTASVGSPRKPPDEESNDSAEFLGDADEGARFDVTGPQSDRDLDAWLAAAKQLSGGS